MSVFVQLPSDTAERWALVTALRGHGVAITFRIRNLFGSFGGYATDLPAKLYHKNFPENGEHHLTSLADVLNLIKKSGAYQFGYI